MHASLVMNFVKVNYKMLIQDSFQAQLSTDRIMQIISIVKWLVLFFYLCHCVDTQCYEDSDISLYHAKNGPHYQEGNRGRPQCIGNYSVISETTMDDNAGKGIVCRKQGSTATDGYWRNDTNGLTVDCTSFTDNVRALCERGSGYVTLYTPQPVGYVNPPTNFTCCIEGLCATVRVLNYPDFNNFFADQSDDAQLETCIIVPPSDITAIPQQYLVQMNTSVIPFSRISSLINCTDGNGITCGQSYYTLIDLDEERYQMTVPVTWSTDSTTNTDHYYSCRVRFGGLNDGHNDGYGIDVKDISTSIKASRAPSSVSYEVVNATAINVSWSISGDVNGFIISITSDGLDTVTIQLTDGSLREYVINGLSPERDYTVEVRGYHGLLGPGETTTVRLESGIISVNASLLSVNEDLSSQEIQINCSTFRVEDNEVAWRIDSVSVTPSSSESVILDISNRIYKHIAHLTESFNDNSDISCITNVNGVTNSLTYTIHVPSLSPTSITLDILTSTSVSVTWPPVEGVIGYALQSVTGNNEKSSWLIEGESSSSDILNGLTQGITYTINVYSYLDIQSTSFIGAAIHLDVPIISNLILVSLNSTSMKISWEFANSSITDNITLLYTRLCDGLETVLFIDGGTQDIIINDVFPGLLYNIRLTPYNILGVGNVLSSVLLMDGSAKPEIAPEVLPLIVLNTTAVELVWKAINCTQRINGAINSYLIRYNTHENMMSNFTVTANTTSTVIAGLMKFQLYYISIAAVNGAGIGIWSEEHTVYTIDYAVNSLSVLNTSRHIQLSWQPLTSFANVTYEYEIAFISRQNDKQCKEDLDMNVLSKNFATYSVITSNSAIIEGLVWDICYAFGVRAFSTVSSVPGDFSVIQGAIITHVPVISMFSLLPINSTSVRASWTAINSLIDNYTVTYTDISCDQVVNTPIIIEDSSLTTLTIHDLLPGQEYSVTIMAANDIGHGLITTANAILVNKNDTPSDSPTILYLTMLSSKSVQLMWHEPNCSQRNGIITGYTIRYYPADNVADTRSVNTTVTTTAIITELLEFHHYYFSVAAITSHSIVGIYSQQYDIYTIDTYIRNLTLLSNTFELSWTSLGSINGAVTYSYEVAFNIIPGDSQCMNNAEQAVHLTSLYNTTNSSVDLLEIGLENDGCYTFGVRMLQSSVSEVSTGEYSVIQQVIVTKAPSIDSLSVSILNSFTVFISWNLSNNSIVDNYTLSYTRHCDNEASDPGEEMFIQELGNSLTYTTLDDLSSGIIYTVMVTPNNIIGEGNGRIVEFTMPVTEPPTTAPLLLTPILINSTAIKLEWVKPSCAGSITKYLVRYFTNDGALEVTFNVTGNDTSTIITGLAEKLELYYFSVAAINTIGIGPTSKQQSIYLMIANTTITGLESIELEEPNTLTLSWQPLLNQSNISYEYEVGFISQPNDKECLPFARHSLPDQHAIYQQTTISSFIQIEGLVPDTCYTFGVRAHASVEEPPGSFTVIQGAIITRAPVIESFNVQLLNSSSALLSWCVSNTIIKNITVSYESLCVVNGTSRQILQIESVESTNVTVNDLLPGSVYMASINAANSYGAGLERTLTFQLNEKYQPSTPPTIQSVRYVTSTSVEIAWNYSTIMGCNDETIVAYNILVYSSNGTLITINTTQISVVITDLDEFSMYLVKVAAINSQGVGVYSENTEIYIVNLSLSYLSINETSDLYFDLSWQSLPYILNNVYSYEVVYATSPNDTECLTISNQFDSNTEYVIYGNTTNDSLRLTGLATDTCYMFGVRAYSNNFILPGDFITVQEAIVTKVPEVDSFVVEVVQTTSLAVSWTIPPNTIISKYSLSYSLQCDSATATTTIIVDDGSSTGVMIDDLSSGLIYSISFVPINKVGEGTRVTETIVLREQVAPSGTPDITSLVYINSSSVRIVWAPPQCDQHNGFIIGYSVMYRDEDGSHTIMNVTSNNITVTGLNDTFSVYYVSVAAFNSIGIGPYSEEHNIYIIDDSVNELSVLQLSSERVFLSWQLINASNNDAISFEYEVAYIALPQDKECSRSTSPSILPNGYGIYYETTHGSSIEVNGLVPDICYMFGVRALASVFDSPGEFSVVQTAIITQVPMILSFWPISINADSVTLNWTTTVSIIDNFTLNYKPNECDIDKNMKYVIEGGLVRSTSIMNLIPGQFYTMSIIPANELGKGVEHNIAIKLKEQALALDFPDEYPVILTSTQINTTSFELTWTEINCTHRNGIITGYSILLENIENGQMSTVNTTDTITSTIITGLTEFSKYHISIAAINSQGVGPYSIQHTVYSIRKSVTGLLAEVSSNESMILLWDPLMNVTDVSYEYEVVYIQIPNDKECSNINTDVLQEYTVYMNTSNNQIVVNDLMSDSCYVFGVRVYTSVSNTPGELTLVHAAILTQAPSVDSLSVEQISNDSVNVSWSLANVIIDYYTLSYTRSCDELTEYIVISNGSSTNTMINNLSSAYHYTIRIIATNTLGNGTSDNVNITLSEIYPPSKSPQFTQISVINRTSVELEWSELDCLYRNGIITGYSVRYYQDGETTDSTFINVNTTSLTVMNLTVFQLYHVSISAINKIGTGPYSDDYQIHTIDAEIADLVISEVALDSVTLRWESITSISNVSYSYEVAYMSLPLDTKCEPDSLQSMPANGYVVYDEITSNSIKVMGLVPDVCYLFGIRTQASVSDSPGSFITIKGVIVTKVPLLTSVDVRSLNTTSMILYWSIVNSIVHNYTISNSSPCDGSIDISTVLPNNGSTTSISISNLYHGQYYTIRITPYNIMGSGEETMITVKLLEDVTPTGYPVILTSTQINTTSFELTWTEINCTHRNGIITGYSILLENIENGQMSTVNTTDTSTIITGLTEFSKYHISIAAINSQGVGAYSIQHTVYTIRKSVTGLLTEVSSNESMILLWDPLMNVTDVSYEYEVVYIQIPNDKECSNINTDVLQEYTVYMNTSEELVEVNDLMSDLCYVFGVRVYTSVSSTPGELTLVHAAILTKAPSVDSLSVEQISNDSVNVSWSIANVIIDYYTLSYTRSCDELTEYIMISNGSSTDTMITNLSSGYHYTIRITATNTLGNGTTDIVNFTLSESKPPNKPQFLVNVIVRNSTSIEFQWNSLNCVNSNGVIIGYSIRYYASTDDSLTSYITADSQTTSIEIGNLSDLSLYFISIAAVNGFGTGSYSDEYQFYTANISVTNVTVSTSMSSSVLLSWFPVLSLPNDATHEYEVALLSLPEDVICDSATQPSLLKNFGVYSQRTKNNSLIVADLVTDICYVFGVRLHISTISLPIEFRLIKKAIVTKAPVIVHKEASPITSTTLNISWDVVNGIIDSYTVSYSLLCDGTNRNKTIITLEGELHSVTIDQLSSGQQYIVSVTPLNSIGSGSEINYTIKLMEDRVPSIGPEIVSLVPINSTSFEVKWTELECINRNGLIIGYTLSYYYNQNDNMMLRQTVITDGLATSTVISELVEFQPYLISIAAINSYGVGPKSIEYGFYTVDLTVSNVSLSTVANIFIVSWKPIETITNTTYRYEVTYISNPDNIECSNTYNSPIFNDLSSLYIEATIESHIELTRLQSDTCYAFGVRAYSSVYSIPGEFTVIHGAIVTKVPSVTSLEVVQPLMSSTVLFLSWTMPPSSIVNGFLISYIRLCDGHALLISIVDSSRESLTLTGLSAGLEYNISIKAINEVGEGSDSSVIVTVSGNGLPIEAPVLHQLESLNPTSIQLQWDDIMCRPRGDLAITGYVIQYRHSSTQTLTDTIDIDGTDTHATTITGLDAYSVYFVKIAAVNGMGIGPYSMEYSMYTIDSTISHFIVSRSGQAATFLTWQPLQSVPGVIYMYEVAYINRFNDTECQENTTLDSLPSGYAVYEHKTANNSIIINGLVPNTCYSFGVRVYTSVSFTSTPGKFTIVQYMILEDVDVIEGTSTVENSSSVAGTASMIVIILILFIIILSIITVYIIHRYCRSYSLRSHAIFRSDSSAGPGIVLNRIYRASSSDETGSMKKSSIDDDLQGTIRGIPIEENIYQES